MLQRIPMKEFPTIVQYLKRTPIRARAHVQVEGHKTTRQAPPKVDSSENRQPPTHHKGPHQVIYRPLFCRHLLLHFSYSPLYHFSILRFCTCSLLLTLLHFYPFTLLHFYTFTLLHFYTFTFFTLLHFYTVALASFDGSPFV